MIRSRRRLFSPPPAWPALMTADILCAYLGDISRQLLNRWRRSADFPPPTRIDGVHRWSRDAIDDWISRKHRHDS